MKHEHFDMKNMDLLGIWQSRMKGTKSEDQN